MWCTSLLTGQGVVAVINEGIAVLKNPRSTNQVLAIPLAWLFANE